MKKAPPKRGLKLSEVFYYFSQSLVYVVYVADMTPVDVFRIIGESCVGEPSYLLRETLGFI